VWPKSTAYGGARIKKKKRIGTVGRLVNWGAGQKGISRGVQDKRFRGKETRVLFRKGGGKEKKNLTGSAASKEGKRITQCDGE